jgi:hypothetical protein
MLRAGRRRLAEDLPVLDGKAPEFGKTVASGELGAPVERREQLEMQASYVPATSLNGAMFQLGLANALRECDDAGPTIFRLHVSVANFLASLGAQVINDWCNPTHGPDDRVQAVIADVTEPALAA